jgi:hypothetical protein
MIPPTRGETEGSLEKIGDDPVKGEKSNLEERNLDDE